MSWLQIFNWISNGELLFIWIDDEWGGVEEMEDLVVVNQIKQKNTPNYERALYYSTWKLINSCPECGGKELIKHHDGSEDVLLCRMQ